MIYPIVGPLVRPVVRNIIDGSNLGGVTYAAESTALFAAMSVQPGDDRKLLIDALIKGLKADGIWDRLDNLQVYAAPDAAGGGAAGDDLLNWIAPGTNNGSLVNAPTFTHSLGRTGNGSSSYINTNFNPTDASMKFVQDDASWGTWLTGHAAPTTPNAGELEGAFTSSPGWGTFVKHYNSNTPGQEVAGRCNNGSTVNFSASISSHLGLAAVDRADSGNFHVWRNGVDLGASLQTSVAPQNKDFFTLATNGASGAQSWISATVGVSFAGKSLGALQANLHTRLQTFLSAIGAV